MTDWEANKKEIKEILDWLYEHSDFAIFDEMLMKDPTEG
jgi:hypothetical protein